MLSSRQSNLLRLKQHNFILENVLRNICNKFEPQWTWNKNSMAKFLFMKMKVIAFGFEGRGGVSLCIVYYVQLYIWYCNLVFSTCYSQ